MTRQSLKKMAVNRWLQNNQWEELYVDEEYFCSRCQAISNNQSEQHLCPIMFVR